MSIRPSNQSLIKRCQHGFGFAATAGVGSETRTKAARAEQMQARRSSARMLDERAARAGSLAVVEGVANV